MMLNQESLQDFHSFISQLYDRYQQLDTESFACLSLGYAESLLHRLTNTENPCPLQLAVIGPTQVGKSTLVNLLCSQQLAEASPLAGFTRHCQGFGFGDVKIAQLDQRLIRLNWRETAEIKPDHYQDFSLDLVSQDSCKIPVRPLIIWDTPDFDSIDSRHYRQSAAILCGQVDLILVVLSKEKYSDQQVWQFLSLIGPEHPIIFVVNKTPEEQCQELSRLIQTRAEEFHLGQTPDIICLPYWQEPLSLNQHPAVAKLISLLDQLILTQQAELNLGQIHSILNRYWSDWTQPLILEHRHKANYLQLVEDSFNRLETDYRRDYLTNPLYHEPLHLAILALLDLIEIPGTGEVLSKIRKTLSWPLKKIGELTWQQFDSKADNNDEEALILKLIADQIDDIQRQSADQAFQTKTVWWNNLVTQLIAQKPDLQKQAGQSYRNHQQAFQPQIQAAADKLYQRLQQQPTTLNSLRAARLGLDTAVVILTLKSGGIGLHDLFLTPAMVGITQLLTEGVLGQYMKSIEKQLKHQQWQSLQEHLLDPLQVQLKMQPLQMNKKQLFDLDEKQFHQLSNIIDNPV